MSNTDEKAAEAFRAIVRAIVREEIERALGKPIDATPANDDDDLRELAAASVADGRRPKRGARS